MQAVTDVFRDRFGGQPRVFKAPGRVNLIGEQTDYNDGFVMPAAIGFDVTVAIAPRTDRKLRLFSEGFGEVVELDLDVNGAKARGHWSDYVQGVAVVLQREGLAVRGADLVLRGTVPMGAGLSSSAALEVAAGYALAANSGVTIDTVRLAKAAQRAENEFVGMRCGIMDQFVSACGHASRALMLDCRSLVYRLVPIPAGVKVIIVNSMVKHALAGSAYNDRRGQCESGVRTIKASAPDVQALRDVDLGLLERHENAMSPEVFARCRHVVRENARVLDGAAALESGDVTRFGELMWASHASLRDDYAVSCDELDTLVEIAGEADGVLGSRMTGGGFGGCTVSLVHATAAATFEAQVRERYAQATGKVPDVYVCVPSQGVHEVVS